MRVMSRGKNLNVGFLNLTPDGAVLSLGNLTVLVLIELIPVAVQSGEEF